MDATGATEGAHSYRLVGMNTVSFCDRASALLEFQ